LLGRTAVGNGLKPFPTKDCLPERQVKGSRAPSPALAGGIFEQSEKNDFFSKLLNPVFDEKEIVFIPATSSGVF